MNRTEMIRDCPMMALIAGWLHYRGSCKARLDYAVFVCTVNQPLNIKKIKLSFYKNIYMSMQCTVICKVNTTTENELVCLLQYQSVNETELDVTFPKVEESLQGALEQHVGVVKQEQTQWLSAASEKVTWCADVSGDKYRWVT